MIDFQVWISQIVGYCEFVIAEADLKDAWIRRDFSKTSVTDFNELYEQIFDDLDADNLVIDFKEKLEEEKLKAPILEFLRALHQMEVACAEDDKLSDLHILLESEEWSMINAAAARVVEQSVKN